MDAGRSGQLGQTDDRRFHIIFGDHHQVCQLIYHNDKPGHVGDICLFPFFCVLEGQLIVAPDIPDIGVAEFLIAVIHLLDGPVQGHRRLSGIRHHRMEQVGDAVIDGQLDLFGIDHQELYFFRSRFIKNTDNDRIDADGFARACCARNQQVRHFGQIRDDILTTQVFAQSQGQAALGTGKFPGFQQLADSNGLFVPVGDLDTDGALAGNRSLDPDIGGRQGQLNVIFTADDTGDLDAHIRLQLIAGDDRSPVNVGNRHADIETAQALLQPVGSLLQRPVGFRIPAPVRLIENIHGWQDITAAPGGLLRSDAGVLPGLGPVDLDPVQILFAGGRQDGPDIGGPFFHGLRPVRGGVPYVCRTVFRIVCRKRNGLPGPSVCDLLEAARFRQPAAFFAHTVSSGRRFHPVLIRCGRHPALSGIHIGVFKRSLQ